MDMRSVRMVKNSNLNIVDNQIFICVTKKEGYQIERGVNNVHL